MIRRYLLTIAIIAIIAIGIALPLTTKADYIDESQNMNNNYILVYPNSISFLFNGSKYINYEGNGNLSLSLSFLNGYKILKLNATKSVENNKYRLSELVYYHNSNGGKGISNYSALYETQYFNITSNGYLMITANPSNKIYYINLSIAANWQGSFNDSNEEMSDQLYSNFNNLFNYNENDENSFNPSTNPNDFTKYFQDINLNDLSQLSSISLLKDLNITGLNITYYNVNFNLNSVSIMINATFNSTEATTSNASMLINNLINNFLKPKFVKINSYSITKNGIFNLNVFMNTTADLTSISMPYNFNLSSLLSSLNIQSISQYNLSLIKNALNASAEIIKYINDNYEIIIPSSLELNVSLNGNESHYSVETPKIAYKGSTTPKENLVSVDYLIGNVSEILQQNGFSEAANKVLSINNVKVTLIGIGVKVKPNQTIIGNLSQVSVTINNNSSITTQEAIGGTIAVVVLAAVLAIFIKKHF
ncbi:MAG: hypothetical protein C0171_00480 [Caldisphaera sp.]|uniref:hypothetical protein n=1 Tax=Caldisphaera sp. TaxID=2060322 RepID=UPI000CA8EA3D|nr:MAG: hypothetical protein C0171_00480 [Caldisphaera sp.]